MIDEKKVKLGCKVRVKCDKFDFVHLVADKTYNMIKMLDTDNKYTKDLKLFIYNSDSDKSKIVDEGIFDNGYTYQAHDKVFISCGDLICIELSKNDDVDFDWTFGIDVDYYIHIPNVYAVVDAANAIYNILCTNYYNGKDRNFRPINVAYVCNGVEESEAFGKYVEDYATSKLKSNEDEEKSYQVITPDAGFYIIAFPNIRLFVIRNKNKLNLNNMDIVYTESDGVVIENYLTRSTKERYLDINISKYDVTVVADAIENYIICEVQKAMEYKNNYLEDRGNEKLVAASNDVDDNVEADKNVRTYIVKNCYTICDKISDIDDALDRYKKIFDEQRVWNHIDDELQIIETDFMRIRPIAHEDEEGENAVHEKMEVLYDTYIPLHNTINKSDPYGILGHINMYNGFKNQYRDYTIKTMKPVNIICQFDSPEGLRKAVDCVEKSLRDNDIMYEAHDIELKSNRTVCNGSIFKFAPINFIVAYLPDDASDTVPFYDDIDLLYDMNFGILIDIFDQGERKDILNTEYDKEISMALNMVDYINDHKSEFKSTDKSEESIKGQREFPKSTSGKKSLFVLELKTNSDEDTEEVLKYLEDYLCNYPLVQDFTIHKTC